MVLLDVNVAVSEHLKEMHEGGNESGIFMRLYYEQEGIFMQIICTDTGKNLGFFSKKGRKSRSGR